MKTTYILRIGLLLCGLLLMGSGSAVAQDGQITVTAATYGNGSKTCDAKTEVDSLCAGDSYCAIEAGNQLCGDPDYGTLKKLTVTYRCATNGEVRTAQGPENTHVTLDCAAPTGLKVQAVAYGIDSGWCDATQAVGYICDHRTTCDVTASNNLCGDPNRGLGKAAKIIYRCNAQLHFATVEESESISLSC